jgi:hypothetical protein
VPASLYARPAGGGWPTCVFRRAPAAEAFPQTDGRAVPPFSFRQVARPDKDMAVPAHRSLYSTGARTRTCSPHGKNTGGARARVLSCRAREPQLAQRIGSGGFARVPVPSNQHWHPAAAAGAALQQQAINYTCRKDAMTEPDVAKGVFRSQIFITFGTFCYCSVFICI